MSHRARASRHSEAGAPELLRFYERTERALTVLTHGALLSDRTIGQERTH